jgi:hypothetical protein
MIKWKFKNTSVYFVSEDKNLLRDVYKNANRVGADPKSKIEITNDLFTNYELDPANLTTWDGSTSLEKIGTLPVDNEKSEAKSDEASGLQSVSNLLDELRSPLASVGNKPTNSTAGKSGGRVAGRRNGKNK